jgi:hypothetical protein
VQKQSERASGKEPTDNRIRAYCRRCKHDQVFIQSDVRHWLHFWICVCTFGLWLISWLAMTIGHWFRPWRCKHCGWHRPEARRGGRVRQPIEGPPKYPTPAPARIPGVADPSVKSA